MEARRFAAGAERGVLAVAQDLWSEVCAGGLGSKDAGADWVQGRLSKELRVAKGFDDLDPKFGSDVDHTYDAVVKGHVKDVET